MWTRSICASCVVSLVAVLAAPVIGARAEPAPPEPIRVGYTSGGDISAAFIARAHGMFTRRGIEVTLTSTSMGSNLPAALESGTLEIGTPTAPVLMIAAGAGLGIVPVSGGSVSHPSSKNHAVLARAGLDLSRPEDFIGKRIGMGGFGGYFDLLFQEWVKRGGLKPAQYTMIELGQAQMNDALRSATLDAVVAGDPNVTRIQQTGAGRVVLYLDHEFPDGLPVIVYAGARRWASAHRAAARAFAEAIAEASAYAVAHPEEWRAIIGDYTKLPPEVLAAAAMPDLQPHLTAAQLAMWNPILRSQGAIAEDVDVGRLLDW